MIEKQVKQLKKNFFIKSEQTVFNEYFEDIYKNKMISWKYQKKLNN